MKGVEFYGLARESQLFGQLMIEQIYKVISTGAYLQSHFVMSFEERMKRLSNRLHGISVNSGTDALVIALRSLGIGPGDEVIVPAYSFVASASCVKLVGATPVYADCADDYNTDLKKAENLITSKTKAIIYAHLFGNMGDPVEIEDFGKAAGIYVIEDAAQAFGARKRGWPSGSIGDVSCFSFDPTKPLSAPGSGGMVLTNNLFVAEACRSLRYHSKRSPEAGYNSQMSSICAAVLEWKLGISETNLEVRKDIAAQYESELKGLVDIKQNYLDPGHCVSKFVIEVDNRHGLMNFLSNRGVETRVNYYKPTYEELGDKADCPVAKGKCSRVLSLPIHSYMSNDEADRVITLIKEWKNDVSNSEHSLLQ